MTFKLVYSDEALLRLSKLEKDDANRILDKLEGAVSKPEHYFERLSGREEWKLRAGDYRVLARIMFGEEMVFVVTLDHRKRIYKKK